MKFILSQLARLPPKVAASSDFEFQHKLLPRKIPLFQESFLGVIYCGGEIPSLGGFVFCCCRDHGDGHGVVPFDAAAIESPPSASDLLPHKLNACYAIAFPPLPP